jgi:hypothetical protein
MQFIYWLLENRFNFGTHKGKDSSQVPTHYLQWMLQQMEQGKSATFNIEGTISVQQKMQVIKNELARRGASSPVSQAQSQQPALKTQPAQPKQGEWILATSKANDPVNNIRKDQKVALKDNKDGNWVFATLYNGKIQHYGMLPKDELASRFQRDTDKGGMAIRADKPSTLAKTTANKDKKEFKLTDEQKQIDERFQEMINSPDENHMVISALAGVGKTSMLKYLSEKYGKPGERWQEYRINDESSVDELARDLSDFVNEKTEKWSGQQKKQGELSDLLEANKAITASMETIKKEYEEEEKEPPTEGEFKNWLYNRLGAIPEHLSPKCEQEAPTFVESLPV